MYRIGLIVLALVAAASARVISNEERVEEMLAYFNATGDPRYSTDIFEDARLSIVELVQKYRYPIEVHHVTTPDGYILEMHRIPHGRDNNNVPNRRKPVVFLMHGLLASSAGFVVTGPGSCIAYILAEAGYDVWMGNARGNTYSRRHVRLNPDSLISSNFWRFSWDEIGNIDLPAMIDYTLAYTNQQRLHYIGHSQGTTSFFVMASMNPEYNQKITSMHALAPVAYMAHNKNPLFLFLAPHANEIDTMANLLGFGELLQSNEIYAAADQQFCRDGAVTQPICSNLLFLVGGWSECQHNATTLPIIMGHLPAGAAVRQIAHYGQGITGNEFRRFDHGTRLANMGAYGTFRPPAYPLHRITAPVFLHYSLNDPLAEVPDVERLFRELGRPVGKFLVPLPTFNHLDFIWGIDAKELLFNRVMNFMAAMDANTFDENDIDSY